jgi:hypothetical protein
MTQVDVARMALEAGMTTMAHDSRIARFASLIAAAEREACADICDQHASVEGIAQRCAEQIRARSKT